MAKKARPARRVGKRLKLTRALLREIDKLLKGGNYESHVYQYRGIPERTWFDWKQRGLEYLSMRRTGRLPRAESEQQAENMALLADFAETCEKARAYAIMRNLAYVQRAGQAGQWGAAKWYLQKVDPDHFGEADTLNLKHRGRVGLNMADLHRKIREAKNGRRRDGTD